MRFFICFALCLFCIPVKTSAIYNVDNQRITVSNPIVASPNSNLSTQKKLSYKERVKRKFLLYKAKAMSKVTRGFLVAGIIFLIIGAVALASGNRSTQSGNLVETTNGCLTGFIGIISLIVGGVMLIAAAVTAI